MKKIIAMALVLFMAYSCSEDETSVFEKSASERANSNKNEFVEALGSTNWVMELFPNDEQSEGGFSIHSQFDTANNKVTMFNELGENTVGATNYDVLLRSGSLLSFNENNKGIHYFSEPDGYNVKGRYGTTDYEFIYLKREGDIIYTKGVKTNNITRLVATKDTPQEYFLKQNSVKDFISGRIIYQFVVGDKIIDFSFNGKKFTCVDEENEVNTSFVFTDKGIRFYDSFKINNIEVFELILDENLNVLKSEDGKVVLKILLPPLNLNKQAWTILFTSNNNSLKVNNKFTSTVAAYNPHVSNLYAQYGIPGGEALQDYMHIGLWSYLGNTISTNISFFSVYSGDNSTTRIGYKTDFITSVDANGEIVIDILKDEPGNGWKWYNEPPLTPMLDLLVNNSSYSIEILEKDTNGIAKKVKMISNKDPQVWFIIYKS